MLRSHGQSKSDRGVTRTSTVKMAGEGIRKGTLPSQGKGTQRRNGHQISISAKGEKQGASIHLHR